MSSTQPGRFPRVIAAVVALSCFCSQSPVDLLAADPPRPPANAIPKPGPPATKAPTNPAPVPPGKPTTTLPGLSRTPVAPDTDAPKLTAADWPKLIAEMKAIQAKLAEWDKQFLAEKDDKKKEAISAKAKPEYDRLQFVIMEQIFELSGDAYEKYPADPEAGAFYLQRLLEENDFMEAIKVAGEVLAKNPKNAAATNGMIMALFSNQEFQKAADLAAAADKDGILLPANKLEFLGPAADYVKYWADEQAVRAKEAAAPPEQLLPRVVITTAHGDITLELFENEAPNTVANFISLVEKKFYDGQRFHRVMPTFMAQGGCPFTKDNALGREGEGGPGYVIPCECFKENRRRHFAGTISMAHTGVPDTGGSQFFITQRPTPHLDGPRKLPIKDVERLCRQKPPGTNPENPSQPLAVHTVFGRVIDGLEIVHVLAQGDQIEKMTVARKRKHVYQPFTLPEPKPVTPPPAKPLPAPAK